MDRCETCPIYWNDSKDIYDMFCEGDKDPDECILYLQELIEHMKGA